MTKQEKELFKRLCSFKENGFQANLLSAATPSVLGQLFFNRMQAVAYGTLKKEGLLGKVNREFRNSLSCAYEQNKEKNRSFFASVKYLGELLENNSCKYAMLKGAYLCKLYPDGFRTSSDIDLLIHPKDVTKIGDVLSGSGFIQGNVRDGNFRAASRREIIESRMTRGEIVPYIKEVNLPGMRFLEVDINLSFDYKPSDPNLLIDIIGNSCVKELGDLQVRTLRDDDFFVHLCSHLYKEATTLAWIEMMRDMTLYKYLDIYMMSYDLDEKELDFLFNRAKQFGMEKICAFAILQMSKLFDFNNTYAISISEKILKDDPEFIHKIVDPKGKKMYSYAEKDIVERFFSNNRKELLSEEWM